MKTVNVMVKIREKLYSLNQLQNLFIAYLNPNNTSEYVLAFKKDVLGFVIHIVINGDKDSVALIKDIEQTQRKKLEEGILNPTNPWEKTDIDKLPLIVSPDSELSNCLLSKEWLNKLKTDEEWVTLLEGQGL